MQKRCFIAMLLFSLFTVLLTLSALADDKEEQTANILEAKKTSLENSARDHLSKMDATITVADTQVLNTTELVIIRGNFNELIEKISVAKDEEELKSIREQLINLAKDFRKQAKSSAVDVYKTEVRKETDSRIDKNKNQSKEYKDRAADARRNAILRHFDNHVDKAQNAIDRLKLKDINTVDVEAKLAEYKNLKPELVSALASENKDQIREASRKVQLNWNQLKKSLREATKGKQISEALGRAEKLADRVQRNIDKMKEKGVSTSALETKLGTLRTKIDDARNAIQLANYDAAEVILKQIKQAYIDLKQSHQDIVSKFGTKEKKITRDDIKDSMEKKDEKMVKKDMEKEKAMEKGEAK